MVKISENAEGVGFGRVCLLGDHCDWAQRQVIASSMDRKIVTRARKREGDLISIRIRNTFHDQEEEAEFRLDEAANLPLMESSLRYVNAVVAALQERGCQLGGTDMEINSDVPMKKGLSSSAALCISVCKALNVLDFLGLDMDDLVRVSYRAENGLLGIGCGMMDQTAAAHESPLFIDFENGFRYSPIEMKHQLPLVVVDLGGERDTKRILNTLNRFYFQEKDPLIVRTLGKDIPELVLRGRSEMEGKCRLERIGELMNRNQECYDRGLKPFCSQELGVPVLYEALEAVRDAGALGAKWTGAGGAGSIIALARSPEESRSLASSLEPRFSAMPVIVG